MRKKISWGDLVRPVGPQDRAFDDDRLNNLPKVLFEGQIKPSGEAHGLGRIQFNGGGIYEG